MSRLNLPEEKTEISMGPMIDCVFLLLIYFLVSTMMRQENKDIDIIPPTSSAAERILPQKDALVIGITRESEVFIDGRPSSRTLMHDTLRKVAETNPARYIRIDADKDASFVVFAEVINACQFYDLNNTGMRTYDETYNRK